MCLARISEISSFFVYCLPSIFLTTFESLRFIFVLSNSSFNFLEHSVSLLVWNGPAVFSIATFLAPASLAYSPAFITASSSPEITICPIVL